MELASVFRSAIKFSDSSICMQTGPLKGSLFLSMTNAPGMIPSSYNFKGISSELNPEILPDWPILRL